MTEKINIAKLLKNCPKDMELNCLMYEDVYFDYVDTLNIIHCYIQHKAHKTYLMFNQHGTPDSDIKSKCVIFPKGKTTWEGFHKPFEDGDIVAFDAHHLQIFIFKDKKEDNTLSNCYLMFDVDDDELYLEDGMYYVTRFATEEEKQKLFDAIKDNGYHWNPETKTLEKLIEPKFKVGDRIRYAGENFPIKIIGIKNNQYQIECFCDKYNDYKNGIIPVSEENNYMLIPKFDINTLQPFDKVLVRDNNEQFWTCDWFSFHDTKQVYPFVCVGHYVSQCIPYEGNEHLLGKTEDCGEYFKNW